MNNMTYYGYVASSKNALYHHGVKNQVWGVMNGPPYPLDQEGKASFRANAKKLGSYEKREARLNSKASHVKSMANLNKQIVNDKSSVKQLKSNNRTAEQLARHRQSVEREQYKNQIAKLRNERNAPRHAQQAKREQMREQRRARHEQQRMQKEQMKNQQKLQKEQLKSQQKMQKERLKAEEKERNAQRKAEEKENLRQQKAAEKQEAKESKVSTRQMMVDKIIQSGDAKTLKKYGKLLTNEEYKRATDRMQLLRDEKNAKLSNLVSKGRTIAEGVKNVADATTQGINTYNNLMKILDAFKPKADGTARRQIGAEKKAKDYTKLLESEKAKQIYENLSKHPEAYKQGLMNQYLGIKDKDGNMIPLSNKGGAKGESKVKDSSKSSTSQTTPKGTNKVPTENQRTAMKNANNALKELGKYKSERDAKPTNEELIKQILGNQSNIDKSAPKWLQDELIKLL